MFISRSGPDQSVYIQIPHIELSVSHTQFLSLVQINSFITRTGNRDKERGMSMVFQNYALYPNMTVYGNMAYAVLFAIFVD